MNIFSNVLDVISISSKKFNKLLDCIDELTDKTYETIKDTRLYNMNANIHSYYTKGLIKLVSFLVKNKLKDYKYTCFIEIGRNANIYDNKLFSTTIEPSIKFDSTKNFFIFSKFSSIERRVYSYYEMCNSSYIEYMPLSINFKSSKFEDFDMMSIVDFSSIRFCFKTEQDMLKFKMLYI